MKALLDFEVVLAKKHLNILKFDIIDYELLIYVKGLDADEVYTQKTINSY